MTPKPPSLGAVTSPFGMRIHPITGEYRMHYGEDTIGDGNFAVVTGTVVFAGYDTTGHGLGNVVGIRLDSDPNVRAWVGHHASIAVKVGQHVTVRVERTGPIGKTGAATGIHAHTEFRVGGTDRPGSGIAINPRTFYAGGGGGGYQPPQRERDIMSITSAGRTKDGSIYAQFEPGCPYYPVPSLAEWAAISAATGAAYTEWGDDKSVITKFGTSTDWAKLAPSTVGGTVNVEADMTETNKLLADILAATKTLNPPG